MSATRSELNAARRKAADLSHEIQDLWKKAREDDNRDLSPEEETEVLEKMANIETCKERITELEQKHQQEEEIRALGRELGGNEIEFPGVKGMEEIQVQERDTTPGGIFVQTEQYKSIQSNLKNGGRFEQVISLEHKAGTLLEGTLAPGSGQGGGLLTVPQVAPGVVEKLFQPVTVPDIIPTGQTQGNTIRYVVEGTATNSAAAVAEGGTKPASDLALSTTDEQVKKLATVLTVSDEIRFSVVS